MRRKEQAATLQKRYVTPNTYNEQVVSWESQTKPVAIVISYNAANDNLTNDTWTAAYNIVGITNDERVKEQDRLTTGGKTYTVMTAIDAPRWRILNLREEVAIGNDNN